MEKHFTATAYVLSEDLALLLFHPKLEKWLPPGGHMEENEVPHESAKREVLEETGLIIEFILQENIWVQEWNATSFPRPYLCLLENIPTYKKTPAHQHIDFIYLAKPIGGKLIEDPNIRWFSLEEILQLKPDIDIFKETQNTLVHLLKDRKTIAIHSEYLV